MGVLNPDIMQPLLAERPDELPSIMVEMAVAAAEQALIAAGREPGEIDLVIVAASNMPRPYSGAGHRAAALSGGKRHGL